MFLPSLPMEGKLVGRCGFPLLIPLACLSPRVPSLGKTTEQPVWGWWENAVPGPAVRLSPPSLQSHTLQHEPLCPRKGSVEEQEGTQGLGSPEGAQQEGSPHTRQPPAGAWTDPGSQLPTPSTGTPKGHPLPLAIACIEPSQNTQLRDHGLGVPVSLRSSFIY